MNDYNNVLVGFSELIKNEEFRPYEGDLRLGVDLGTANIVVSVVDSNNTPIAGASYPSTVVRDGIVVDFMGASRAVRNMKAKLEDLMGVEFYEAATAVPPGIISGNVKVISNVVESVGLDVINVVDEPTAAASVLGITNGAVVDVGGGTTGISILKDGEVIFTADEPTGGTHMTLVLAGSLGCSFEEAVIYVVGGACSFKKFESVFEKETGVKTIKPKEPLLVTPLGIAMNCNKQ